MKTAGLRHLGAALVVLLGVWAGFKFHAVHGARDDVSVPAGTASPPDPRESNQSETLPQPVIPARLPQFSLKDLDGRPVPVSSWTGKSLMINFWATWCAPCQREIPLLKALAMDWKDRDLQIVGIAVDDPDKVRRFAKEFHIDYPLLVGEQDALDVAAGFGMVSPGFPFTVFTDGRGEVVALFLGELHRPQAEFILSQVQNLNSAKSDLKEARREIAEGLERLATKNRG
jgi:thiol-disulfide isomerase/thioredoxin